MTNNNEFDPIQDYISRDFNSDGETTSPKHQYPQERTSSNTKKRARLIPRPRIPRKILAGVVGAGLLTVGLKEVGLPIPAVPEIHEELHALPPEIDDSVVVTKLGAIGAFSKSEQTYKSKAYIELVNDRGEERETLGYKNNHRVIRTQEGKATIEHDDQGNKVVTLPNTFGILARGDFSTLHDDKTGRDAGQAITGWLANSQTSRDWGETMINDAIEDIAINDTIANRQTLCVGVAAVSQLLSDVQYESYFVPTWQADGVSITQPADTRLMTVQSIYEGETLNVNSCAKDLVKIGYDVDLSGNMYAGANDTIAEAEAGMLLPERKLDDVVLKIGMEQYNKNSKSE